MKVKKKWFAAVAALLAILFVLSSVVGFLIPTTTPPAWQGVIAPYQNISVEEAYAYIEYGVNLTNMVVLDVRTPAEYNASHIAGGAFPTLVAINIPYDQLLANLSAYGTPSCPLTGDQNDLIIVYCRVGIRSSNASETLVNNPYVNFTNVYNVIGGMNDYYLNTIGDPSNTNPTMYWNYSNTVVVNATAPPPTFTVIQVSDAYQMITNGSSTYGSCNMLVDTMDPPYISWIINSTTPPILNSTFIQYDSDPDFATRLGPLAGYKNLPIIVYCLDEACDKSVSACQYLVNNGFTKVYRIYGGLDAWSAAYPTLLGPLNVTTPPPVTTTFGYTTIGSQHGQWGSSTLDACKYTSPASITTISQISVYMAAYSGTVNAEACIYADNSGVPGALLATSTQVTGIGTTPSWVNFTLTLAASPSTVYWLGVEASNNYVVWFTSGSTKQLTCQYAMSYPTFPNPWTTESAYGNYMQSIYASYT